MVVCEHVPARSSLPLLFLSFFLSVFGRYATDMQTYAAGRPATHISTLRPVLSSLSPRESANKALRIMTPNRRLVRQSRVLLARCERNKFSRDEHGINEYYSL